MYKKLLNFFFKKLDLVCINTDNCIFVTKVGLDSLVVSIFIDYIKIIAPKKSGIILQVKTKFMAAFLIVDISLISFYLKLKIEQNQEKQTIKLSQPAYINKVLSKFYLDKAFMATTLMKKSIIL